MHLHHVDCFWSDCISTMYMALSDRHKCILCQCVIYVSMNNTLKLPFYLILWQCIRKRRCISSFVPGPSDILQQNMEKSNSIKHRLSINSGLLVSEDLVLFVLFYNHKYEEQIICSLPWPGINIAGYLCKCLLALQLSCL